MDTTTVILIVAAAAVAALILGRLSHKTWPGVTAKTVEASVVGKVHDLEAVAEADAMAALSRAALWLTDESTEDAKIAAAVATKNRKAAMRQRFAATFVNPPAST